MILFSSPLTLCCSVSVHAVKASYLGGGGVSQSPKGSPSSEQATPRVSISCPRNVLKIPDLFSTTQRLVLTFAPAMSPPQSYHDPFSLSLPTPLPSSALWAPTMDNESKPHHTDGRIVGNEVHHRGAGGAGGAITLVRVLEWVKKVPVEPPRRRQWAVYLESTP